MDEETKKDLELLGKAAKAGFEAGVDKFLEVITEEEEVVDPTPPDPEPDPVPEPEPDPEPQPTGVEFFSGTKPEVGSDAGWGLSLQECYASRGETISIICRGDSGISIENDHGLQIQAYRMPIVTTTQASYIGAQVGEHYDPLIPVDLPAQETGPVWLDITVPRDFAPGRYGINISGAMVILNVWKMTMPERPSLPIYMGLTSYGLLNAHGLQDHVSTQGPICQVYNKLYRDHRIEPYGQDINNFPPVLDGRINMDRWSEFNASFRQLVIDGAIAPPMILRSYHDVNTPSESVMQAIEASLQAGDIPSDSWAYVWDEQQLTNAANAIARARRIAEGCPNLRSMVTWTAENDEMNQLVDIHCPVLNWYDRAPMPDNYWLYTSCMAQGRCSDTVPPADPTGHPLMLLDSPGIHPYAFPWVVHQLGAQAALYYHGTLMLGSAYTDQFREGGNGEGTMCYMNGDVGAPSIRMKLMRNASFDLEYLFMADAANIAYTPAVAPVTSPTDWSKEFSVYQTVRNTLGQRLDSQE